MTTWTAIAPDELSVRNSTAGPERDDWSALMGAALAGDRDAYRRLLDTVIPYLRCLARRHFREPSDVEDAVQDVLLAIHATRYTYDPVRPFGPWLATIARRRIVDRLRSQGRIKDGQAAFAADLETEPAAADRWQRDSGERERVRDAVACLPTRQRTAIELLKLRDLSLKEASALTGMSVPSLKVATHRALGNLRRMLEAQAADA